MKKITIFLCAILLSACGVSVKADEVVIASQFGFNAQDATECLQKAIDSGAKKVVVDKRDEGPWIVKTINLRSELELVLQEGVEILAKQGEFRNKGDVLFRASAVSNLIVRGEGKGATLRMRKKEYWNEPYEKSEWRHGLSLLSSQNVLVENLTIAETGGDGIYLGVINRGVPCRNITIRNVDCVANNRQGISVISVDGLVMEDVLLRDTVGTAPEAGIDFEPNRDDEQITNVVMRRVTAINNRGGGFDFYLVNLKNIGKELSVVMEDCRAIRNNAAGFSFHTANGEEKTLPGSILIKDTTFDGNFIGVAFRSKWADGAPVVFKNVKIITPKARSVAKEKLYDDYDFNVINDELFQKWTASTTVDTGISLIAVGTDRDANGGFAFDGVEFVDADPNFNDCPLLCRDASSESVGFRDISGKITATKLDDAGDVVSTREYEVNDENLARLFPQLVARRIPPFELSTLNNNELTKYSRELADAWAQSPKNSATFRARGGARYAFYATSGQEVSWNLQQRAVGKYAPQEVAVSITTPSNKETTLEKFPGDLKAREFHYRAEEDGWFLIKVEFGASSVELTSSYPILTLARPSLDVFGTSGTFRFYVPNDSKDLGVRIVGSPGERVTVTIVDPDGNEVQRLENVGSLGAWSIDGDSDVPNAPPKSGFWTIRFEKPTIGILEDYIVTILGVPALIR